MEKLYWIWSKDNSSWWKARGWGYTRDLREAYQYDATEAHEIQRNASRHETDEDYPDTVLIPVTESFLPRNQRAALAATLTEGSSSFDELDALVRSLEELEKKKTK